MKKLFLCLTIFSFSVKAADRERALYNQQLIRAVQDGKMDTITWLISPRADLNARDIHGDTPLIWAVRNDNQKVVQQLLHAGANVNLAGQYGYTPLITAAIKGFDGIAQILLADPQINIDAQDNDKQTALMHAVNFNHPKMVQLLLAHPGINLNAKNVYGTTAVMMAATKGRANLVQLLLQAGADRAIKNKAGQTATDLVEQMRKEALKQGNTATAKKYKQIADMLYFMPPTTALPYPHPTYMGRALRKAIPTRGRTQKQIKPAPKKSVRETLSLEELD